ncbi:MAG: flagellar protein FliS [Deltaproteobacteria bacterium]|nr:flagellar protein FliS [Deltaproteobacteria bacterium]
MNAIAQYRSNRVHGATPGELVVLLLETAGTRLDAAREHMEAGRRMAWIAELAKVRPIYLELMLALDHGTAPELTRNLHVTYAWAIQRLGEVGKTGDLGGTEALLRVNNTLLDAFRQVVIASAESEAEAAP